MPRAFLAWIAALAVASWIGITLAEIGRFSVAAALAGGALAAAAVVVFHRPHPLGPGPRGETGTGAPRPGLARAGNAWWTGPTVVPIAAAALLVTLQPPIDTTLLSQDASIHRASGIWLARTGSLEIPDATLVGLDPDEKRALLGSGSVSPRRFSLVRLPGGIVLPDLHATSSYPSFSHLLAVWIAIADVLGGAHGILLLAPIFAFTAWWAVGLIAIGDGGLIAAAAALALLVTWLPEHWFARFLMPEILTQALVWGGIAAARLAGVGSLRDAATAAAAGEPAAERSRSARDPGALLAGVIAGTALGTAAFARLEQLWVFVPALLVVRALLPARVRLLPRGALIPFLLACVHAAGHLALVPTDYGNRIFKAAIGAFAQLVVLINALDGGNGYVTQGILRWGLPLALLLGAAAWLAIGTRIDRRHPGFLLRASAGAFGIAWLIVLYGRGLPAHLAAVRSLFWYVPWATWIAVAIALTRFELLSGLEIALGLLALDQVVSGRVSPEQIWASRRLVPVVLPLLALLAARATGARWIEPRRLRLLAQAAVVVAILGGIRSLAPTAARSVQGGGDGLVADVAASIPPDSLLLVARPLDWTHLAPALWLGHDRTALVMREHATFEPAFRRFLERRGPSRLYILSGEVASPDAVADGEAALPALPPGWSAEQMQSFRLRIPLLETTRDRPPAVVQERDLALVLHRVTAETAEPHGDSGDAGPAAPLPQ